MLVFSGKGKPASSKGPNFEIFKNYNAGYLRIFIRNTATGDIDEMSLDPSIDIHKEQVDKFYDDIFSKEGFKKDEIIIVKLAIGESRTYYEEVLKSLKLILHKKEVLMEPKGLNKSFYTQTFALDTRKMREQEGEIIILDLD